MSRFLIVGGGVLLNKDLVLAKIGEYDHVIAVDSGYDNCLKLGLTPDVFIGDADSVLADDISCCKIKFNPIKDDTDLKLAVNFAIKNNAENIDFICVTGGRIDHLLNNLSILNYTFSQGVSCRIIDECNVITPVDNVCKFENISKYVSVLPIENEIICSVTNMKYPMDNMMISHENIVSISNECVADCFEISMKKGSCFVIQSD